MWPSLRRVLGDLMADDRFIWMEFEDEHSIMLKLDTFVERKKRELKDMLDDLGDYAVLRLLATVPVYNAYIFRHIDRTEVRWHPGGAGGGGEYEVVAGIKRGDSQHPLYAEFGTGIYVGRGMIRPLHGDFVILSRAGGKGNVLTFQKHGEPRKFRPFVRGQKGQRYFYRTWRDVQVYASARVLSERIIGI